MIRKFKHSIGNYEFECINYKGNSEIIEITNYINFQFMNGSIFTVKKCLTDRGWIEIFDDSPATTIQMKPITCEHTFKSYTGLIEQFEYCSKCDMRKVC
jgi:hypothetical protein